MTSARWPPWSGSWSRSSGTGTAWQEDVRDAQEHGDLHDADGEHVGKDDQEDDIVVIVPEVPVPVVNGARCSTWFQTKPPKDIHERRDDKDHDKEPGDDDQDQAVGPGLSRKTCRFVYIHLITELSTHEIITKNNKVSIDNEEPKAEDNTNAK